jgi:hypothetical protein
VLCLAEDDDDDDDDEDDAEDEYEGEDEFDESAAAGEPPALSALAEALGVEVECKSAK